MHSNSQNRYCFYPNWGIVCVAIIVLLVITYMAIVDIPMYRPQDNVSFLHVILIFGVMLALSRGYILEKHQFTVTVLGVPVRKIPWSQVGEVIFMRNEKHGKADTCKCLITLLTCEPFLDSGAKLDTYLAKHPFDVFLMNVPKEKANICLEAFNRFYGNIIEID